MNTIRTGGAGIYATFHDYWGCIHANRFQIRIMSFLCFWSWVLPQTLTLSRHYWYFSNELLYLQYFKVASIVAFPIMMINYLIILRAMKYKHRNSTGDKNSHSLSFAQCSFKVIWFILSPHQPFES